MIPFVVLALVPFVAADAGLAWSFDGTVTRGAGRYGLVGGGLRGDVTWFVAPKGGFSAQSLYESDIARTKDAPASRGFAQTRRDVLLAGHPAIGSEQRYAWNGVPVASRCVYCAAGRRAWVVRLWWPPKSGGAKAAEAFLKSVRPL